MKDPTYWLELIYQQLATIAGGGTPANPDEVNLAQVGGTAVANPLDVSIKGTDDEDGTPVDIGARLVSGGSVGAAVLTLIDTGNGKFAVIDTGAGITEGDDLLAVHDPTIGLVADAAVPSGAGTISGKLRALVETITAIYNATAAAVRTIPAPSTTANTPSIVTAAATDAFAANAARKVWSIQNMGTNTLYVRLGTAASATVFHFALKPGTVNDDGNGGFISDEIWKGIVSYAGTSPRFVYSELT